MLQSDFIHRMDGARAKCQCGYHSLTLKLCFFFLLAHVQSPLPLKTSRQYHSSIATLQHHLNTCVRFLSALGAPTPSRSGCFRMIFLAVLQLVPVLLQYSNSTPTCTSPIAALMVIPDQTHLYTVITLSLDWNDLLIQYNERSCSKSNFNT